MARIPVVRAPGRGSRASRSSGNREGVQIGRCRYRRRRRVVVLPVASLALSLTLVLTPCLTLGLAGFAPSPPLGRSSCSRIVSARPLSAPHPSPTLGDARLPSIRLSCLRLLSFRAHGHADGQHAADAPRVAGVDGPTGAKGQAHRLPYRHHSFLSLLSSGSPSPVLPPSRLNAACSRCTTPTSCWSGCAPLSAGWHALLDKRVS